jgi:hypothetical protein
MVPATSCRRRGSRRARGASVSVEVADPEGSPVVDGEAEAHGVADQAPAEGEPERVGWRLLRAAQAVRLTLELPDQLILRGSPLKDRIDFGTVLLVLGIEALQLAKDLGHVSALLGDPAPNAGALRVFDEGKSNGTRAGTVLAKDIWPGAVSSSVSNLTNVNGTLYFSATTASTASCGRATARRPEPCW